ncbi:MAG: acyl-CoA dehydrogenase family protein [Myxococcota bacterium]|nr:acyl-CoA/acyl-ACP dehydrogenase [Myxococcales bacterium]
MNPDFTETQQLLQTTVRQYVEDEVPFDRVREHEQKRAADDKLWEAISNQGWLGIPLPEAVGGGDAGLVEAGIFVHELARRAAVVPATEVMTSAIALARFADGDESALLAAIVKGAAIVVPAVLEADDDLGRVEARVDAKGALTGEKDYVDYADFATHHLVVAVGPEGRGLYLVERAAPGVTLEARHGTGRTPQSTVRYAGVPARRVAGTDAVDRLVDVARALTCAQLLGCMEVALEMTVAYTNVRVQFGQPLAAFQAVQHHAADMCMQVESNRFLVYELLDGLENGRATSHDVAIAKASASRSVAYVTMQAHQLHGGQGLIEENDLYFFSIRGKDRALAWGTAEECLAQIARDVEDSPRWL